MIVKLVFKVNNVGFEKYFNMYRVGYGYGLLGFFKVFFYNGIDFFKRQIILMINQRYIFVFFSSINFSFNRIKKMCGSILKFNKFFINLELYIYFFKICRDIIIKVKINCISIKSMINFF